MSLLRSTTSFSLFSPYPLLHVLNLRVLPCWGPQEAGVTAPVILLLLAGKESGDVVMR